MPRTYVLLVADEREVGDRVNRILQHDGYRVVVATSGADTVEHLQTNTPSLILLHRLLPDMDGLDLCKIIKSRNGSGGIPVIVIADHSNEEEIIASLESGAEDHIAPPFSSRLLLARVRVVLRSRAEPDDNPPEAIQVGRLMMIPSRREVFLEGRKLELSPTEFDLLRLFLRNPERVFTREEIILKVKGADYPVTKRSVDVQVVGLRRKLGTEGSNIRTVWGVGYTMHA